MCNISVARFKIWKQDRKTRSGILFFVQNDHYNHIYMGVRIVGT